MRSYFCLLVYVLAVTVFSQEKNSLLWEISGNGLEKSSYLYGTMHVSKKIAFRLDDVFYEALVQSEKVALESDPATWLGSDINMENGGYGRENGFSPKGFYTYSFAVKHPRKDQLAAYLAFEDRLVNNILYRTSEYSQNFEEETYLDMFIYQAGRKFDKPVIALEDLEESTALVGRASLNAMKQKPDEWLQKKMQRQDLTFLMQDAYRERNINLLDSIERAMYTDHYLRNMLYIRNEHMASSLDSAMRTAKVFAGIGAAHLPGELGVISLLRKKGYTVNPLVSPATSKGQKIKETIETTRRVNNYTPQGPDDDFFTISLPSKLYPVSEYGHTTYLSPDLVNGSYFMVNRVPVYSFLKKVPAYTPNDIDGLLFENIPGNILQKTRIRNSGFEGLDIRNQLKNGDHQRYQIYITPLEILIFKMGGEGDFVSEHSDSIFNSLKFRTSPKNPVILTSAYNDFEISMPSLYTFSNRKRGGSRSLEGYDSKSDSYYFLRKATLNDFNFIEEDSFELKQIQKRFFQELKLSPKYGNYKGNSQTSSAMFDTVNGKKLHLKTAFNRGDYYLMGALTKDSTLAKNFFDSFKISPATYPESFKKVKDTALLFSTVTSVNPPKFVESSISYHQGGNKQKPYSPYTKKTVYQNKNNEAITVELTRTHDYLMFPSIDSVWALREKQYADKKFIINRKAAQEVDNGRYELVLTLTDTASTRGILIKNVIRGSLLYEIKAHMDTLQKPSAFVSEFFENFTPEGPVVGRHILEDKTSDFFAALRANDSIVLSGHRLLYFDEKHIDSLEYYIANFDFPADKKHIQSHLIQKMGQLNDARVVHFFRDYYARSYNNSRAQTKILQAVARTMDEASVRLLLSLMAQDLPLTSNTLEIQRIFKPFNDSLPLAKKLYPEILDYSTIAEYKLPIFSLLVKLKSKGLVRSKHYRKYKWQFLNDAKIQLKRHLGRYNHRTGQSNYNRTARQQNGLLEDYVVLLYPFIGEPEVRQFFSRLSKVKDPRIRTTYATLMAKNNHPLPVGILDFLAADINSRGMLYNSLGDIGKLSLFPKKYKTQQALAEASLFMPPRFNNKKDTVRYIEQQTLQFKGKAYTGYYFKIGNKQDINANFKMHLIVYEAGNPLQTKPFYKNEGLRIEDTDSDDDAMAFVTEAFILKDRKRAIVYRPDQYGRFGY